MTAGIFIISANHSEINIIKENISQVSKLFVKII